MKKYKITGAYLNGAKVFADTIIEAHDFTLRGDVILFLVNKGEGEGDKEIACYPAKYISFTLLPY